MSTSPDDYRAESRDRWEQSAAGWEKRRAEFQQMALGLSQWMVEAIAPQPGHRVLELAAGLGDTGLLAAELVAPGGEVLLTDGAEAMVEAARRNAEAAGATNVEARAMEAEWIDVPTATMDGVLCRFGYMLLADPETALRETRRVLKPGGRVALAVWDTIERNPWLGVVRRVLNEQGVGQPADPDAPGPFRLSAPGAVQELLETTGFAEVQVEPMDLEQRSASLDDWWESLQDTSAATRNAVSSLTPAAHYRLRDAFDAGYQEYVQHDGSLIIPARALVAAASA
ncbi:MAG: methyltransferase domain-containing protein [Solirubrobacteraceae bacterium]